MARKIHPIAYRLGITKTWDSRWISPKNMAEWLRDDEIVRTVIMQRLKAAGVARIEMERTAERYKIFIKASRPGLIIGRGGKGIEELTKAIEKALKKKTSLSLNVEELKRTEISAQVISQNIVWDLERRMRFRRVIKKHLENTLQNTEVTGARISVSGRLDGSEIARREWLAKGKISLHTLRADVDYGESTAFTTYGTIGVKVWVCKGEIFNKEEKETNSRYRKR
ncbi:MAG: 30S ribosomal protein S3 [bacterium]